MKIKKSTIDQLVKEELSAMMKERQLSEVDWKGVAGKLGGDSLNWDNVKRQLARGFTSTGNQDSFLAKFVGGIAAPGEAKESIEALQKLIAALNKIPAATVGKLRSSVTKTKARNMPDEVDPAALAEVARSMLVDLGAMFADMGPDAPEQPGSAEAGTPPSGAPGGQGRRPLEIDESKEKATTGRLRRQIRRKLRRLTS